jgi:hypothetical protein
MSSTTIVTGALPFEILIATVFAFPICFVLLNLYRRSVLREMSRGSGELVTRGPTPASRPPVSQIRIVALDSNSTQNRNGIESPQYRRASLRPWRASAAYTVGCGLCGGDDSWLADRAYFAFLVVLIAVELAHNAEMGITELPMFWLLLKARRQFFCSHSSFDRYVL